MFVMSGRDKLAGELTFSGDSPTKFLTLLASGVRRRKEDV